MTPAPGPPALPESYEAFTAHASENLGAWFNYFRQAHEYIMSAEDAANAHRNQLAAAANENTVLREDNAGLRATQQLLERQHSSLSFELAQARAEVLNLSTRSASASAASPLPTTPDDPPADPAQPVPAPNLPATPARPVSTPDQRTHLSERLPDPAKFEGDRKDLQRFLNQIEEKMAVNRDRFPTPQARIAYVNGRLGPTPYALVIPHISKTKYRVGDYNEILEMMERAYGDPNRISNARDALYNLRQSNKDFASFFAEFARLALEAEMDESALPAMLKQAVSREIRGMMVHHDPPSEEYHAYANWLQSLENRLRAHSTSPPVTKPASTLPAPPVPQRSSPVLRPAPRYSAVASAPPARFPVAVPALPAPPTRPARLHDPDPMDLSHSRRLPARTVSPRSGASRRERGECFRCGSSDHIVRDCPYPDTRPLRVSSARQLSPPARIPARRPSPPGRTASVRSNSPDSVQGNGVSLG